MTSSGNAIEPSASYRRRGRSAGGGGSTATIAPGPGAVASKGGTSDVDGVDIGISGGATRGDATRGVAGAGSTVGTRGDGRGAGVATGDRNTSVVT